MKNNKPKWWVLYALFPLMVGGLLLINRSELSTGMKSAADIALVIATFTAMVLFMRVNEAAIEHAEYEEAMRARAKSQMQVMGWRSQVEVTSEPAQGKDPMPATGAGSARNNPLAVYTVKPVLSQHGRLHVERRRTEKQNEAEREY